MKNRLLSILLAGIMCAPFLARADADINLPDQITDDSAFRKALDEVEGVSTFVSDYEDKPQPSTEEFNAKFEKAKNEVDHPTAGAGGYEDDEKRRVTEKEKARSTDIASSDQLNSDQLIEIKNKDIIAQARPLGDKFGQFTFGQDKSDYQNSTGSFDHTFRSPSSDFSGLLRFTGGKYLNPASSLRAAYLIGVGASYHGGEGYFKGVERSTTVFKVWTFPADLGLMGEINMGYVQLAAMGGPSVMGLLQNRSDFDRSDTRRSLTQISPGYFGAANVRFDLSFVLPESFYQMKKEFILSKMQFVLEGRYQSYANFKTEDLSVTGVTFGAGLGFEFF